MNILMILILSFVSLTFGEISKSDLLDEVTEKLSSIKSLTAEFTQEQEWDLADEVSVSSGKIYMMGRDIYRIEQGKNYIIFNKNLVYRYNSETDQILIEKVEEEDSGSLVPVKLIFDFPDYFNIDDFTELGDGGYKLFLTPKKMDESFILSLNTKLNSDFLVTEMEIVDIDDNRSTFKIGKLELNKGLDKKLFQQPNEPSAEVMDLR